MEAPKSKAEFYPRWLRGEFGNRLRAWDCYADLQGDSYRGPVTVRYKEASSPRCKYEVAFSDIEKVIAELGGDPELYTFNESAPDSKLLIQGEVYHGPTYSLYYSELKTNMREALKQGGKQVYFTTAKCIMQHYMRPKSYMMIQDLFDLYPNCVIEFGCYSRCLGEFPGHNVIIWEVRNY